MNLQEKKFINFCTDQELRVVSIKDSIMNCCISNGKERENKIFHVSNDKNSVVSKSSSGCRFLAENTLQNGSIDNHTSAIFELYIRPSNV